MTAAGGDFGTGDNQDPAGAPLGLEGSEIGNAVVGENDEIQARAFGRRGQLGGGLRSIGMPGMEVISAAELDGFRGAAERGEASAGPPGGTIVLSVRAGFGGASYFRYDRISRASQAR
jgi:hypothetical protein